MPEPLFNKTGIKYKDHIVFVGSDNPVLDIIGLTGMEEENITAAAMFSDSEADNTDWSPLKGKTVYLWGSTENGILKELKKLEPAPKVFFIDIDRSVTEFLEKYDTDAKKLVQLKSLLANSKLTHSKNVSKRIEDTISGKRETIRLPWYGLHYATQALKPGTVTLLCGRGGAAKSFCLLQMCQYWYFELGHKVAIYELEEDREYHLMRSLAQRSKQPKIMDEEWVKKHPDKAREIYSENKEYIERMGSMIYEAPTKPINMTDLAEWVDKQAKAGKRVICIDPITAANQGQNVWIEDQNFIIAAKKSIVESGASLVVVTHPKKGGGELIDMDSLSGGACWQRFSQTILWLKNPGEKKEVQVLSNGMRMPVECDRIVSVLKARNAGGGGYNFAMTFRNFLLEEIGEIVRKKGKSNE